MQEIGVVEKLLNNGKNARVVFPRRTECDKCGMCMRHKKEMTVSIVVKNTLNVRVGDRVSVGMKDGFVLRAAFIVYVIPIVLVGVTLGLGRNFNELLLLGLVFAALCVGLVISVVSDRLIRKKGVALPQLESIVSRLPDLVYADQEQTDEKDSSASIDHDTADRISSDLIDERTQNEKDDVKDLNNKKE